MRPPAHQNKQKDAQAELIGQLLPHQRPYAQPLQGPFVQKENGDKKYPDRL